MKAIWNYQRAFSLFLSGLMAFGTISCYSRRQIQPSRLSRINIETLQFIVVDPDAPRTNMWLLSSVKIEETALNATLEAASPKFIQKISSIKSNFERRAHQDMVLLYVDPSIVKTYNSGLNTRLEFRHITRIEVFERDGGKDIGLALGGVVAVAGLVGGIFLLTFRPD
ncbi:MAG: hypothetical protein IPK76_07505 [Lewinellaceae bacterium]|jgi:hypothetical protein|nr:hypothetical protein [Lewinellaceae bacterium]